jgi:hypothetical protein
VTSRSTPLTCPHVLSTWDMSSCALHKGHWAIPSQISVLTDQHTYPFSDKPKPTYPFSDKCPTYPFSDKCPHRSTQLSHRGVRSGECLRKLQTSTLPLSEGGILFHAKSVTKVLKLHPGLVRTSTTCSSVGRYCTSTSFCTMSWNNSGIQHMSK